ncbi:hypothetical protein CSC82_04840 [Rhodobacteraceae bacterium 4F10]|nr:hypothetical protein CSC82_04840 [Rhodobacteraceae bacterium 4F10]
MLPPEIQNAEIIDWWETERDHVWSECDRQFHRLCKVADEVIDGLSATDAIWFQSDARDDLKRMLSAEVEMHNRRLARHLAASYDESTGKIEALSELGGASTTEYATAAASVAAGAGAVGLAIGAGAFIPATSTMLFIPVAAMGSWPIAATLGTGALAVAWFSPKIGSYAIGLVQDRYKRAVRNALESQLVSEDETEPLSSWKSFSIQLDNLAQSRMVK